MKKRRVVVTGLGVVTSIGIQIVNFWNAAISGVNGISKIDLFDTTEYESDYGGQIKKFDPTRYLSNNEIETMGISSQYALTSARLAENDSELNLKNMESYSNGVIFGSAMGEAQIIERIHKDLIEKKDCKIYDLYQKMPACNISKQISRAMGINGSSILISNACSSGNFAIGYGFDLISSGKKRIILAGGTDVLSEIAFKGFSKMRSLDNTSCKPFDKNRKGIMIGEGAACLVLEEKEHAKMRNAKIYAEIMGYGVSCDAYHMIMPYPDGRGIVIAMEKAINASGISPNDVDYISAHGNGNQVSDKAEVIAIKKFFKEHSTRISINSIKSMIGHTMGAASAIEALICCMAVKNDIIPPTINYQTFDPDCDIDCVPNHYKNKTVKIALNNSFAFGGNNISMVFKKYLCD